MSSPPPRLKPFGPLLFLATLSFLAACGSDAGPGAGTGTGGAANTGGGVTSSGGATTGGAMSSGGTTGASSTTGAAAAGTGGRSTTTGGSATTGGSGGVGGSATTGAAGGVAGATGGAGGAAAGASGSAGKNGSGGSGAFTVTSPGWMNMTGCAANMAASCATLPKELTRTGGGVGSSPELNWTGTPAGTKSFAVVLQDLSGNSTHWVLWNISASETVDGFTFFERTTLAANVDKSTATPAAPVGSQQCSKDPATGAEGYYGPGACGNVYEFTLYALSVVPFSPTTPTDEIQVRTQLLALGASILGTASTRGRTFAPNCP